MKKRVLIKRAYEPAAKADGYRVLVDRVWPRGISKDELRVQTWAKDIAPTTKLRQWFGHDPERWPAFRERYESELSDPAIRKRIEQIIESARDAKTITLVYGAKDEMHNQAVVLQEIFKSLL